MRRPGPQAAQDQTIDVAPLVVAPRSQAILADLPAGSRRCAWPRCAPGWRASSRSATSRKARPSKGDLLFTIEPAPFEAALAGAGRAGAAQAQVRQAQALADRYQPLVKIAAVSRQEYDDAVAALQTAKANQVSAQADVKTAQLDLGYASVRAPISGRIGRGLVTEGSLVGQGESTPMALIQQLDPVYADFRQPVNALLKLREGGGRGPGRAAVVDGTGYTAKGKLLFSDVSVDPGTGQVMLRGQFSNPDGLLLPGMYVRVSAEQGVQSNAIFVPQRAVMRGADGQARCWSRPTARRRSVRCRPAPCRDRNGRSRRDWPRATRSSSTAPPRSRRHAARKRPAPRRPPSKPRNERDRPARRPASAPRQP